MAVERKWLAVPPRSLLVNGNQFGLITIADTIGFKVKQTVVLRATTQPDFLLQVKRVISNTQLIVGRPDNKIGPEQHVNISAYTVALGANIYAEEQDKAAMPTEKDHYSAIYEGDPTVADRVILVDPYGRFYGEGNPLPIAFDGTIAVGNVTIQDDDGDELEVNPDGSINVNVLDAAASTPSDPFIENISIASANTEYSFAFPAKTIRFLMRIRDGSAKVQFAWASGDTNVKFMTMNVGTFYSEETQLGGKTIYFQANKANQIMELLYWKQP